MTIHLSPEIGATFIAENGNIKLTSSSGNASLELKAANGQDAKLSVKTLDVQKGTVKITGNSGTATIESKTITLGKAEGSDEGKMELSKGAVLGIAPVAGPISNNTSLTITQNGNLTTVKPGDAATMTVNAAVFNLAGGKISAVEDGTGADTGNSKMTINLVSGTIAGGSIDAMTRGQVKFSSRTLLFLMPMVSSLRRS